MAKPDKHYPPRIVTVDKVKKSAVCPCGEWQSAPCINSTTARRAWADHHDSTQ